MELPLQIEGGFNHEKLLTSNSAHPSGSDKILYAVSMCSKLRRVIYHVVVQGSIAYIYSHDYSSS